MGDGLSEWCSEWCSWPNHGRVFVASHQPVRQQMSKGKITFGTPACRLHWHATPMQNFFSLFRCRPLPAIECKLNRAAHEVNFTCISLAISACSTQRVMLHGEKMRLSSVHATKAKRNSFSKMVSISKKSN